MTDDLPVRIGPLFPRQSLMTTRRRRGGGGSGRLRSAEPPRGTVQRSRTSSAVADNRPRPTIGFASGGCRDSRAVSCRDRRGQSGGGTEGGRGSGLPPLQMWSRPDDPMTPGGVRKAPQGSRCRGQTPVVSVSGHILAERGMWSFLGNRSPSEKC